MLFGSKNKVLISKDCAKVALALCDNVRIEMKFRLNKNKSWGKEEINEYKLWLLHKKASDELRKALSDSK